MSVTAPVPVQESAAPSASEPAAPGHDEERAAERAEADARRRRRLLLWVALVALLLVAQSLLVWLTFNYESNRAQEEVDAAAASVVADVRQAVARDLQSLQALMWSDESLPRWQGESRDLLKSRRELMRLERRDLRQRIVDEADSPFQPPLFTRLPRQAMDLETEIACSAAGRLTSPSFSRSYFVPLPGGMGLEVIDVCLPIQRTGQIEGYLVATLALQPLLTETVGAALLRTHELSFIEGDGTRLTRAGLPRGAGVYVAERLLDLPGQTLRLRVDSNAGRPQLIPNLAVALVLGLSLALGVVVLLLARDVRRRSAAEHALAEALAFRKAMEDSLLAGLRARDLHGRVTYVNPAFCEMVGFSAEDIIGRNPPPYWPPEMVPEYSQRQRTRLKPVASRCAASARRPAATRARASRPPSCAATASASRC